MSKESNRPLNMREESLCPCKSKKMYAECCQPFHLGRKRPETAEKLMRSRYSAFFFRLSEYLFATTHPDKRGQGLLRELEDSIHHTDWQFLTIVSTSKGQKEDKQGKVRFIAKYYWDGEEQELEEHSRFKKFKGAWKYFDEKG